MRSFGADQGAEPEAKPKLLLRIRQRRAGSKRPFAALNTFSTGCWPGTDKRRRQAPACLAATLGAGLLCVGHLASFDFRTAPLVTDVRYYVYYAWRVAEGAVPHLDFFDVKTQLAVLFGGGVMAVAESLGADPLLAVRVSFLGLAASAGFLIFLIFRALGQGRSVAGLLGVLAYCSFPVLGLLPAVGVIPKLIMAVMASAGILCTYHRKWVWAGVCGALAFMDWQVGGLVGVAVLVTAARYGERPARAVLRVLAGGAAGLAPFVCYYAVHGGLRVAVGQVLLTALQSGSAKVSGQSLALRLGRVQALAEEFGADIPELFYGSFLGVPIAMLWIWTRRDHDTTRLLLPLGIYHLGIIAFSTVDFALVGDFYILLHSVVFFLGITWLALYESLMVVFPGEKSARWVAIGVLMAAILLCRPSLSRPAMMLRTRTAHQATVLADQREVAALIGDATEGKRVAYLDRLEVAYLLRYENPLPIGFWNPTTWRSFREPGETSSAETAARLIASVDADAFVANRRLPIAELMPEFVAQTFESKNGRYSVTLHTRQP